MLKATEALPVINSKKGFHKCVLTATNDAKYLYQNLGFEDHKTMKVYHEP